MFNTLSKNLTNILEKLTKKGIVTESDVNNTLREVRISLLEADVALEVVKDLIEKIKVKATGQSVIKSVTPGQQVIKIVNDELVELLSGKDQSDHSLKIDSPPASILMVGLQGSGKTTTSAKLANFLKRKENKKVLMASLDTSRPAAMEQLKILGNENQIDVLEIIQNQKPLEIATRAEQQARLGGYDVFILDTAGRMHISENLMDEIIQIKSKINPNETLLVVDGLTGQDAVNVAKTFNELCNINGIVITKLDGDSRGGAALSMRAVTKKPIKFIGIGEKSTELELFDPVRISNRILGMGDIVTLVEKAQEKLKSYQDLFEELIDNGSEKISKDLIPEFVNGKPDESMDLNEAAIRFQMFAGLDPVGPKEMVSRVKFEELRNRFTEKSVDLNEKLKEHFTNLVYSKGTSDKKESADVKKAMAKALKKVEELLP